jgi:hypothetical protein
VYVHIYNLHIYNLTQSLTRVDKTISLHILQDRTALRDFHLLGLCLIPHHIVHLEQEISELDAALTVLL